MNRIEQRLEQSQELGDWIHSQLHDRQMPGFDDNKRMQLAAASWHVAIEHSQAIPFLIGHDLPGAALALIRPMFDSYLRGMWLGYAASDEQVDAAGRDESSNDVDQLLNDLERSKHPFSEMLKRIKAAWWKPLCSFTHSGYQQLHRRLAPNGLGWAYEETELIWAVNWADSIALQVVLEFSGLFDDETLGRAAIERQRTMPPVEAES